MTSIMHPGTYARVNAIQAKQSLQDAATTLRNDRPKPLHAPAIDSGFIPPYMNATRLATAGVSKLDAALGMRNDLSHGVVTALESARATALDGVRSLGDTKGLHDGRSIALTFDASAMWIDLAVNLIDLDMRGGRPPVTILPVPGPGEPGFPVTIKPIAS